MRQLAAQLAFTLGIVACSIAASVTVRSQTPTNSRCPVGYWLVEPVCLNNVTGDVVNATRAQGSPTALEGGCVPGYWRLGELCVSPMSGDVELVDEQRWPAGQGR
jgi:hypothetical protein